MRIALVQQHASENVEDNRIRGLQAMETAARQGAQLICFAELGFEPFYPQSPADGDVSSLAETIRPCAGARNCQFSQKKTL